jgi:hypothetical protein
MISDAPVYLLVRKSIEKKPKFGKLRYGSREGFAAKTPQVYQNPSKDWRSIESPQNQENPRTVRPVDERTRKRQQKRPLTDCLSTSTGHRRCIHSALARGCRAVLVHPLLGYRLYEESKAPRDAKTEG